MRKILFLAIFCAVLALPILGLGASDDVSPRITKILPTSGAPGSKLVLYGQNLRTDCLEGGLSLDCIMVFIFGEHEINWRKATALTKSWSPERIEIEVPDEALTGPVGVYRSQIFDFESFAPRIETFSTFGPTFTVTSPDDGEDPDTLAMKEIAQMILDEDNDEIIARLGLARKPELEQGVQDTLLTALRVGHADLTSTTEDFLRDFVSYGVDKNTHHLGAGERAAVVASFKAAFGGFPTDDVDVVDLIKIANGRWPAKRSGSAEEAAMRAFERVYLRMPDLENPHDANAVMIMSYGLRQRAENRNLDSEAASLSIYHNIFNRLPESTRDWNTLQAIAYSGAKR